MSALAHALMDALEAFGATGWGWSAGLFVFGLLLGIVAVMGGVGGGVLFVPLVGGFLPFHMDFVRCAGLVVALASSLSAVPELLYKQVASFRLALPLGLIASVFSIVGARVGLAMPERMVQTVMGLVILGVYGLMVGAGRRDHPVVSQPSPLGTPLGLRGWYHEASSTAVVTWRVHRVRRAFVLFAGIGFVAGMFGLGAGWANVPALNLLMGVPLKIAVGTSLLIMAIANSSAAWVYINQGAVFPLMVAPAVIGAMLGSTLGARWLVRARPALVRQMVLGLLVVAGLRSLLKGVGVWP